MQDGETIVFVVEETSSSTWLHRSHTLLAITDLKSLDQVYVTSP